MLSDIVLAFLSMFIVDLSNSIYIKHIQNDSAVATATASVFIFVTHSTAVISYVNNHWMLIPAALGGFAGALLGVEINKRWISR
jgi:uncharacterized membrane protein YfcA